MENQIETPRTILRNFIESDLNDLFDYCSQAGVGEPAGWLRHESLEQSTKKLNDFIKAENQFAIVYKENNKVIGHIGINDDSENNSPDTKELGFVLNKDYWNQGIMTEVLYAVLGHLFSTNVDNVYACCFQSNSASKHLIEKCGFAFEQEGTFYAEQMEKTFETFEYVYTKDKWKRQNPNN